MEEDQTLSKRERKRLNREKKREAESKKESQSSFIKKSFFVGAVILIAFFVWSLFQGNGQNNTQPVADFSSISEVRETDNVKGNPDARLVLVEYGDFQCPACADYHSVINQLSEANPDDLAIVYRHFPLNFHRNAKISAQAAEAAGNQGAFWQMHDLLFERQQSWQGVRDPRSDYISYAEELGLNIQQFEEDMNSDQIRSLVDNSYNEAVVLGLNSTPTFLLNGEKITPAPSVTAFQAAIDDALSQLPEEDEESTDSADLQE